MLRRARECWKRFSLRGIVPKIRELPVLYEHEPTIDMTRLEDLQPNAAVRVLPRPGNLRQRAIGGDRPSHVEFERSAGAFTFSHFRHDVSTRARLQELDGNIETHRAIF